MTIRPADDAGIAEAAALLQQGGIVAFPTETVYGLGADATQDDAVAKIFKLKGRPNFNPLIVHIASSGWLSDLVFPDRRVEILVRSFWPGPLTLVLPRRPDSAISHLVSANLETLAVRQPDHPVAAKLLAAIKRPLAAPSANLSGHVSPTLAAHVAADFGPALDMILEGGPCRTGLESTVLDLTSETARILRPGAIGAEDLTALIGTVEEPASLLAEHEGPVTSPGQLDKHYAPSLPVRLNAAAAISGEALIGFAGTKDAVVDLSPRGDLSEAAANLFAALRRLDEPSQFTGIAVTPIPNTGVGFAINDRLRRAAKGR